MNASSLVEKGKYEKALEKLNKAESLAEKAKSSELFCRVLLHKGEILDSMDNPYEALLQYEKALETSLRFFISDPQDSSSQRCLYNSIDLIENILKKIDDVSVAVGSYECTSKYFDKVMGTYEKLIVEHPENSYYISNYIKTVNNLRGYLLNVGRSEKQIQLINSTLEAFNKILNIQPENPENMMLQKKPWTLPWNSLKAFMKKTRKTKKTILSSVKPSSRTEICKNPWETSKKRLKALIPCFLLWKNFSNQTRKVPKLVKMLESHITMLEKCILLTASMKSQSRFLKEP